MKSQRTFQSTFRGDDGFVDRYRRMMGKVIFVNTRVFAVGRRLSLVNEPRARFGVITLTLFAIGHYRGTQITALRIGQRNRGDRGH